MINFIDLYRRIQPYRIHDDSELPWVYQKANPVGRPNHGDWEIPWLPSFIQPWGKISRLSTAYKAPFPFEMIAGNATKVEVPLPMDYPTVPGVNYEIKPWYDGEKNVDKKWVWAVEPIQPAGHWALLAVSLPGGLLEPCFYTRSVAVLGNKIPVYYGLKPDYHPVDSCAWMWEASLSVKWGSLA